jgi:para-nitrobenzyl esterase
MQSRVRELLGEHSTRVIDVYKKGNPGASPSDIYFLIASDNRYGAPVMKIAERRAMLGKGLSSCTTSAGNRPLMAAG